MLNNIVASILEINPSRHRKMAKREIPIRMGISFFKTEDSTIIGERMAVVPKISPIFEMFDPKALPRASPGLSSMDAITETNNSGAEVPKPITSIPIKSGERLYDLAIVQALLMN